jgi:lantibiotic biosynthesis protein
MQPSSTNPMISNVENVRTRSVIVATKLADRLSDPLWVGALPEESSCSGPGLRGDAGIALFMAAMAQVSDEPRYRATLHARMKAAAHSAHRGRGLFGGVPGLLAASRYAMCIEPRYEGLLEKCALALGEGAIEAYAPAGLFFEYDLLAGRAGEAIARATALSRERARAACDYLVWMIEDPLRWRCPHPRATKSLPTNDLGMAHGLAGMLAALAIAAPSEAKYDDALAAGMAFLCEQRTEPLTVGWPSSIKPQGPIPGRSAWCYGTPGCAIALLQGSLRLRMPELIETVREALTHLAALPIERWNVPDHALCHGHVGNAMIFAVAAQEIGDEDFSSVSGRLVTRVLDAFDDSSQFGYYAWMPEGFSGNTNLLEGIAGIGLALLTMAGACDSSWMQYFGLPRLYATPS